jgi:DNA-binding ferritin-like protein
MTLSYLADIWQTIAGELKDLHLNLCGTDFWSLHELLGELYDEAASDYDTLAEMAIHHGEDVGNPNTAASRVWAIVPPDRHNIDYKYAAKEAVEVYALGLYAISHTAKEYADDLGVQNELGDLYQRADKDAHYKLKRFLNKETKDE